MIRLFPYVYAAFFGWVGYEIVATTAAILAALPAP